MSDMDGASMNDANVQGGQQHSSVNAETEELKRMLVELQGQVRALQGNKDRSVNQTKKDINQLQNEFAKVQAYIEKYGDPVEAQRQFDLDEMIRQAKEFSEAPGSGGTGKGVAADKQAQEQADKELLELLGVDGKSPEYLKAIGEGLSPYEAAKAVAKAKSNASGVRDGQAIGLTGSGGGSTGVTGTQEQILQSQYEAELKANPQMYQGNPWNIEQLKRAYRAKGLNIW